MARESVIVADGPLEVELLPSLGARIHRLRAFGADVLRTPTDVETHIAEPHFWGSYVMAPWGGRIDATRTVVGGREVNLRPNFADGTAIHGQVADVPWEQIGSGGFQVHGGGDGWPWPYSAMLEVSIRDATLGIRLTLVNLADEPMPAGLGLHPWFLRPLDVQIRGSAVIRSNTASAPLPEPVADDHDLRTLRTMPPDLDATWVDLGDPAAELRWTALGIAATLRVRSSADAQCIVAASPGGLDAIAVEPQTHGPQGLRRLLLGEPYPLSLLEPGASLRMTTEISFRR